MKGNIKYNSFCQIAKCKFFLKNFLLPQNLVFLIALANARLLALGALVKLKKN